MHRHGAAPEVVAVELGEQLGALARRWSGPRRGSPGAGARCARSSLILRCVVATPVCCEHRGQRAHPLRRSGRRRPAHRPARPSRPSLPDAGAVVRQQAHPLRRPGVAAARRATARRFSSSSLRPGITGTRSQIGTPAAATRREVGEDRRERHAGQGAVARRVEELDVPQEQVGARRHGHGDLARGAKPQVSTAVRSPARRQAVEAGQQERRLRERLAARERHPAARRVVGQAVAQRPRPARPSTLHARPGHLAAPGRARLDARPAGGQPSLPSAAPAGSGPPGARTRLGARAAVEAAARRCPSPRARRDPLRVVAPRAGQRAALEEHRGAHARPVVERRPLHVEHRRPAAVTVIGPRTPASQRYAPRAPASCTIGETGLCVSHIPPPRRDDDRELRARAAPTAAGFALELFDRLPDVVFFAKDARGAVRRGQRDARPPPRPLGAAPRSLGRTARELFPGAPRRAATSPRTSRSSAAAARSRTSSSSTSTPTAPRGGA